MLTKKVPLSLRLKMGAIQTHVKNGKFDWSITPMTWSRTVEGKASKVLFLFNFFSRNELS